MLVFWTDCSDKTYLDVLVPMIKRAVPKGTKFRRKQLNAGRLYTPHEGEVCVVMGAQGIDILKEKGILAKNKGIEKYRGTCVKSKKGGYWVFTYAPSITHFDMSKESVLRWDIALAYRLLSTGSLKPDIGEYRWVKSFSSAINCIKEKYEETGKKIDVALDLETMGLVPFEPGKKIVTVFLSHEEGFSDGVYLLTKSKKQRNKIKKQLKWLLTTDKVSMKGANLKYDLIWLRCELGLKCTNFKMDTLIVGSLLNENRSNSLNAHAKEYTTLGGYDDWFNQTYDKGHMEVVPKKDLLTYAGGDTDACLRVAIKQRKEISKHKRLTKLYTTIVHPGVRVFEDIEFHGLVVDRQEYARLRESISEEIKQYRKELIGMMPRAIREKHKERENMLVPAVLQDFLFTKKGLGLKPKMRSEKTKKPSTSYDHLMMFLDDPVAKKFIDTFKLLTAAEKTRNTYIDGFLEHLRSDGRFHPTYALYNGSIYDDDDSAGTVTGRTSARDPAVQCLEGSMRVLTDRGWMPIQKIVEACEQEEKISVLTHTGKIKPVIGHYRNGIKPVFTIVFEHGKVVTSTGNHPYLTNRGWVRADELKTGDTCYALKRNWFRPSDTELYQPNLLQLDSDEKSLSKQKPRFLQELRRQGYKAVQALAPVPELFRGYGGETRGGLVDRPQGCERELHSKKLPMESKHSANKKSKSIKKCQTNNLQGENSDRSSVGAGVWNQPGETPLSVDRFGTTYGDSLDEKEILQCGLFEECKIESIVSDGDCETYDLTIQDSHSFVCEGIIVHNTIPKHTKYAKPLRKCFVAPKGWTFFQIDFDQGELKISACLAEDNTMLQVYRSGGDLHSFTGARFGGYTLEKFMKLKETNREQFDDVRRKAKAGNFGLIYGMQAPGYKEFARTSYGVDMSEAEAVKQRNIFFKTYDGLEPWHGKYKNRAYRDGFVVSPLGRIRHLPLINSSRGDVRSKAERQAVNSPVQSCLSDMCVWSLALIRKRFTMKEVWLAGMTHDSIYGYIPDEYVQERLVEMKHIMETLPLRKVFKWDHQIPFTVSCETGINMADLKEVTF